MFIREDDFVLKLKLCLFLPFLELKLNTKQGTVKERINLILPLKCIRKKFLKRNSQLEDEENE